MRSEENSSPPDDRRDALGQAPTDREVIAALEQTGFLLEQRVAKCLRAYDFHTNINHAYPDPDTGKSREMDVCANLYLDVSHEKLDAILHASLVVECKNSASPFVVIGEDEGSSVTGEAMYVSFDPLKLNFTEALNASIETRLRLRFPLSAVKDAEFMGTQLVRMTRQKGGWRADNTSVYESILYPLAKARDHEWDSLRRSGSDGGAEPWQYPYVAYMFPVIVTSGPIFTVDASADEPRVSLVKWTRMRREFKPKEGTSHLVADLVSFSYLGEYLENRPLKILEDVEKRLVDNAALYDPEWLRSNLGVPKQHELFERWRSAV